MGWQGWDSLGGAGLEIRLAWRILFDCLKLFLGWAGDSVGLEIWLECRLLCVGLDILLGWSIVREVGDLAGWMFGFVLSLLAWVADLVESGWDGVWDGQGIASILVGF